MTRRNWATSYSIPNDHGRDSDLPPELLALQDGLSQDPSIAKVWLGPQGPGTKKNISSLGH